MIFRNRWNQIWMRVRWWKNEGNRANFYGRFYECQEDEVPDENFYLGNAAESQGHLIHWGKKEAVLTKGSGKIRAEVLKLCKFDERLAASGYSYDPKFGEKDFQNLKPKLLDDDSSDSSDSSSDDGSWDMYFFQVFPDVSLYFAINTYFFYFALRIRNYVSGIPPHRQVDMLTLEGKSFNVLVSTNRTLRFEFGRQHAFLHSFLKNLKPHF